MDASYTIGEPLVVNLIVHDNCGFHETMVLEDEQGAAVPITGDAVEAQVRATPDDASALILDLAPTVSDGAAGKIAFAVSEASIAALTADTVYAWDLKWTPSGQDGGNKIAAGSFVKKGSATA